MPKFLQRSSSFWRNGLSWGFIRSSFGEYPYIFRYLAVTKPSPPLSAFATPHKRKTQTPNQKKEQGRRETWNHRVPLVMNKVPVVTNEAMNEAPWVMKEIQLVYFLVQRQSREFSICLLQMRCLHDGLSSPLRHQRFPSTTQKENQAHWRVPRPLWWQFPSPGAKSSSTTQIRVICSFILWIYTVIWEEDESIENDLDRQREKWEAVPASLEKRKEDWKSEINGMIPKKMFILI